MPPHHMQISQTQNNSRFNCSKLWKKVALYSVVSYFLLTNSLGFAKDFKLESSCSSSDPANGCCRQKDLPNGSNLSTFRELVIMREYSWKKIKFFSFCLLQISGILFSAPCGPIASYQSYVHVPLCVTGLPILTTSAGTARGTSIQIWSKLEQNPDYCALPHVVI